ncbi:MAG: hypothetical protein ND866_00160 [Pyrinomonadaceae bacterium]|nr:hypothetical protein [Pyrinomonadaceae bacterium]
MSDRVASLNIVSPDAEGLYFGAVARCAVRHRANSLRDLRALLERQLDGPPSAIILDLMGHSTRDHHLLRLGDDRIDMLDSSVAHFFRSLAHDQVLSRLEVVALRLLGCETAVSPCGKRTLRLLASTLRIPVFGTLKPLMKSHYNKLGFDPAFAQILVEASEFV